MSYARMSPDSDVYIFQSIEGFISCHFCGLDGAPYFHAKSTDEILAHLEAHKAKGDKVPDRCIAGLLRDKEENDRFIAEKESAK